MPHTRKPPAPEHAKGFFVLAVEERCVLQLLAQLLLQVLDPPLQG
jgi:hypothetical protein